MKKQTPISRLSCSMYVNLIFIANIAKCCVHVVCSRRHTLRPFTLCATGVCRTVDQLSSMFGRWNSAERLQTGYRIICTCQRKLTAFSINYVYTKRFDYFSGCAECVSFIDYQLRWTEHEKNAKQNKQAICHSIRSVKCHGRAQTPKDSIQFQFKKWPCMHWTVCLQNRIDIVFHSFVTGCLCFVHLCDFDFIFLHAFSN